MKQVSWVEAVGGKVCLIDRNGNVLLEPQIEVDALSYPSNGISVVKKDGKYGYINARGELVIPFQYKKAYPFSENGLAFVVGDDGLGGYIDKSGQFVIEPMYETGSMFQFGFAAVSKDGVYEYIYKNGHKAIGSEFKYASGFSDCGLAKIVTFDGIHQLMDTMSRVVLTLKAGNELEAFQRGTRITKFRTEDGREALINAAGQIFTGFFEKVVLAPYSTVHPFLRRGLWGYVNNEGEEVIPNVYKEAPPFGEDKMVKVTSYHPLAENEEVELYINEKDEVVTSVDDERWREKFSYVDRFQKSVALAVKKEAEQNECDEPSEKGKTVERRHETQEESTEQEKFGADQRSEKSEDEESNGKDEREQIDNGPDDERYHTNGEEESDDKAEEDSDDEDDIIVLYERSPYLDEVKVDIYEVEIFFHDKSEKDIIEFIRHELKWTNKIIGIANNYVKLLWVCVYDYFPDNVGLALRFALDREEIDDYFYVQIY